MNFHVGQKVICIKRGAWSNANGEIFPVFGGQYTIRGFDDTPTPGTFIYLEEIVNKPQEYRDGWSEASFNITRFRPLIERKTNISIFERMLTPTDTKVKA